MADPPQKNAASHCPLYRTLRTGATHNSRMGHRSDGVLSQAVMPPQTDARTNLHNVFGSTANLDRSEASLNLQARIYEDYPSQLSGSAIGPFREHLMGSQGGWADHPRPQNLPAQASHGDWVLQRQGDDNSGYQASDSLPYDYPISTMGPIHYPVSNGVQPGSAGNYQEHFPAPNHQSWPSMPRYVNPAGPALPAGPFNPSQDDRGFMGQIGAPPDLDALGLLDTEPAVPSYSYRPRSSTHPTSPIRDLSESIQGMTVGSNFQPQSDTASGWNSGPGRQLGHPSPSFCGGIEQPMYQQNAKVQAPPMDVSHERKITQTAHNQTARKKRPMTASEKARYREVRKVGACNDCKKSKRQCKHAQATSRSTSSSPEGGQD